MHARHPTYDETKYLDAEHVTVPPAVFTLDEQSHVVLDNQVPGQQPTPSGLCVDFVVICIKHIQRPIPGLCVVHIGQRSAPAASQVWVRVEYACKENGSWCRCIHSGGLCIGSMYCNRTAVSHGQQLSQVFVKFHSFKGRSLLRNQLKQWAQITVEVHTAECHSQALLGSLRSNVVL